MLKARKVHFIGVGGYGMSALAMVLKQRGTAVSGSDVAASARTQRLAEAGVEVHIGAHDAAHIEGADVVVYSTQVPEDNPELAAARARGLRVLHRSELLAEFLNGRSIAVAGTHGKTTTSSMVACLLEKAGLDPTILLGGDLEAIGGTGKAGRGDWVVAEADESDRSFLRYHPRVAVVTNVEPEHLEFWEGSFARIQEGFRQFLRQVQPGGLAALCADDPTLRSIGQELRNQPGVVHVVFYGTHPEAEWRAENIRPWEKGIVYDCVRDGRLLGEVRLPIPGRHNALNSLGALVAGDYAGLSFRQMQETLLSFGNARRRFEVWADVDGIRVVDDYAHHPTEIRATLAAAREQAGRRVVAVFQPQRYSRTHWLMDEFATAFQDADALVLTRIYSPPGERPIPGVSAEALARRIQANTGRPVAVISDQEEILRFLLAEVRPGDTVITMGAGDIWKVARALAQALQSRAVTRTASSGSGRPAPGSGR